MPFYLLGADLFHTLLVPYTTSNLFAAGLLL